MRGSGIVLWMILVLLWSQCLQAQTPDTATLHGQVEDQNHQVVPGASITLRDPANGSSRSVSTDNQGHFVLFGLPSAQSYSLSASKSGFAPIHVEELSLTGGGTAYLRLRFNLPGQTTSVLVTGVSGQSDLSEPQPAIFLDAQQMQQMPLLNRRITYLPLLNAANRPALNQGDLFMDQNLFTTNGSGRRQTWFEVDGANDIDAWGRQTLFTNLPLLAVKEMTVIDSAASPEYGFGMGGVVNIVTQSGTNRLHGEALGLWRPSGLTAKLSGFHPANATSGNDLTSDTLQQGAASLSGPMARNGRTQFFLSGEYSHEDRASPVTSPLAPGNFIGHYQDWMTFLRLDHRFSDAHTLWLRTNTDSFYDTNPNGTVGGSSLPSVDRVFRRRTYSQALGETAVLSPAWVSNLRLQFQLASPITQFDPILDTTQFVVPVSSGGTFTSGTSQSALLLNRQYEVSETLALARGRHNAVFGGQMIHAHNGGNSKEYGGPIYKGQFVYHPCTASSAYCESSAYLDNIANVATYTQSYGNANYRVNDTLWALFLQDNLRVTSKFVVNLGLRYEQQAFTDARLNFAPRLGFSYDVFGQGRTLVQGGFGIYYAQVVDNAEANYALTGPTGVFNYTAAPGQPGFPASISAAPLPAFPPGAQIPLRSLYIRPGRAAYLNQFFPVDTLVGYPSQLLNPYSRQQVLRIQQHFAQGWLLDLSYLGTQTNRNVRPLDVDPPASFVRTQQGQIRTAQAANCTRPYWVVWYQQHGMGCNPNAPTNPQPLYSVIQSDVNDGFANYNALNVNLQYRLRAGEVFLASYTWSHTMDNVDPDVPSQNPNDPNFPGAAERGNASFDQRHRLVLSGVAPLPAGVQAGGIATFASALPFNYVTGSTNSGDLGATTDRPVIDGAVVGRNTGRGRPIYQVDPFLEKTFVLPSRAWQLRLRAEAFNVLNHANFVGYSSTYGNGTVPGMGFGQPLQGVANQLTPRTWQFSTDIAF